jgi:transposase-like protein
VEQRYQAVLEVLHDGATVTDVARRHGVASSTRNASCCAPSVRRTFDRGVGARRADRVRQTFEVREPHDERIGDPAVAELGQHRLLRAGGTLATELRTSGSA